jgi:hypothetical protein
VVGTTVADVSNSVVDEIVETGSVVGKVNPEGRVIPSHPRRPTNIKKNRKNISRFFIESPL